MENTEPYRVDNRRREYGDERDPEIAAFFQQISPMQNADRITVPVLFIQGGNDPRVPQSEADQIVKAVGEKGNEAWYFLAMDEGHGFSKKSNRDQWKRVSVLFLETALGIRPAAPAATEPQEGAQDPG